MGPVLGFADPLPNTRNRLHIVVEHTQLIEQRGDMPVNRLFFDRMITSTAALGVGTFIGFWEETICVDVLVEHRR
jgi:hypothetical protein